MHPLHIRTSLIKNPGGTFAPSGGYIIGKAVYVKVKRVCIVCVCLSVPHKYVYSSPALFQSQYILYIHYGTDCWEFVSRQRATACRPPGSMEALRSARHDCCTRFEYGRL